MYCTGGYFKHRYTVATHAYAILISPENRKRKPYALPVQLISYVGMGQENIRKVFNNLISKMKGIGMQVAGKNYLNCVLRLHVCMLFDRFCVQWRT